jgi:hypothetical protein
MNILSIILNLPWTMVGLLNVLISVPGKITVHRQPLAFIIHVKSFWWYNWRQSKRGVRAIVNGHVVLLGPNADTKDLHHEIIHIRQSNQWPLIYPVLYAIETLRRGYRHNKYEIEAYAESGSRFS